MPKGKSQIGILLSNLGTPDAPTIKAVRKYLAEFLYDPKIIKLPAPLRWLILHGFILPIRPKKSAAAYQKIWTDEGSPLLAISRRQYHALQNILHRRYGDRVKITLGMRYGNPSIRSALADLRNAEVNRLLVLPLYPQYSETTTGSTLELVAAILTKWNWQPKTVYLERYYDHPDYIDAIVDSIHAHWGQHGRAEKLLFSFHGLPQDYADAGDPYPDECQATVRLIVEKLPLQTTEWALTFQSRLGPKAWLKPYTDITLQALAANGLKRVDVICPGFSADCLETLEEIDMQNRAIFLTAGGETFSYIPALNDRPQHITMLQKLIEKHLSDLL